MGLSPDLYILSLFVAPSLVGRNYFVMSLCIIWVTENGWCTSPCDGFILWYQITRFLGTFCLGKIYSLFVTYNNAPTRNLTTQKGKTKGAHDKRKSLIPIPKVKERHTKESKGKYTIPTDEPVFKRKKQTKENPLPPRGLPPP